MMKATTSIALLISMTAALIAAGHAMGQVYKTIDEEGNVVYTDQPPPQGAEPMKLRELSIVEAPEYQVRDRSAEAADGEGPSIGEMRNMFRDFRIVSPTEGQNLWGTGNVATLSWMAGNSLLEGMTVRWFIDDSQFQPTTDSTVTTPRLDRGEHKVRAELRDAQNRTVATAGPVTFYVMQNSRRFGDRIANQRGGG